MQEKAAQEDLIFLANSSSAIATSKQLFFCWKSSQLHLHCTFTGRLSAATESLAAAIRPQATRSSEVLAGKR